MYSDLKELKVEVGDNVHHDDSRKDSVHVMTPYLPVDLLAVLQAVEQDECRRIIMRSNHDDFLHFDVTALIMQKKIVQTIL